MKFHLLSVDDLELTSTFIGGGDVRFLPVRRCPGVSATPESGSVEAGSSMGLEFSTASAFMQSDLSSSAVTVSVFQHSIPEEFRSRHDVALHEESPPSLLSPVT